MKSLFGYIATSVLVGGVASYGIWQFQSSLLGDPPTKVFSPDHHAEQFDYKDPDLERLREATKVRPKERAVWMSLARELLSKANKEVITRQQASLEAIDALRSVLDLDENDVEALLLMGDISFDMEAFTKALEFYQRYLEIRPDDDATRARYASTLSFVGRGDEGVVMLQGVIARNPDAFQPQALLMLAYALQGDREKMIAQSEKALALAPNEEAKARLNTLLTRVTSNQRGAGAPPQSAAGSAPIESQPPAVQLGKYLKDNPVAGPKIQGFDVEDDVFVVYVSKFPMQAMPPFAKEKFFGGIIKFVKDNEISELKSIRFVDQLSGKEEGILKLVE